jgi:hypothetical protein
VVREFKTFISCARALTLSVHSVTDHVLKGAAPTAEGYRMHLKAAGPPYPPCPHGVTTKPIIKAKRYIGLVSINVMGTKAWQCTIRINGRSTNWRPVDLLPKKSEKKSCRRKNDEPAKIKGISAEVEKNYAATGLEEEANYADGSVSEEEDMETYKAWADKDEAARAYDEVAGRHGSPTNFPVSGKAKAKTLCAGCAYCAEVDACTGEVMGARTKRPKKWL